MNNLDKMFEEQTKMNGISCILFDGRRDDNKVMLKVEGINKQFPCIFSYLIFHISIVQGGEPNQLMLIYMGPSKIKIITIKLKAKKFQKTNYSY